MTSPAPGSPRADDLEASVLEVVRILASETGGGRASRAVSLEASLERDLGLGSLERVELLVRLEVACGRTLDDRCLGIDTPAGLVQALLEDAPGDLGPRRERASGLGGALPLTRTQTIQETLWRRAEREPDRPHVFLREDDGATTTLTHGRLLGEALAVAGGLRDRGIAKSDTVALMLPTGLDFLRTFQGILLAGAVPVPIYPPLRLDRLEEYALRQAGILADAGVRLLVSFDRARPVASILRTAVPSLTQVVTAEELCRRGTPPSSPEGSREDPAFIQYTSGSTGQPKGVLLTHANLLANIEAIGEGLGVRPDDVGASWLPLYHDMGLIGSWLFCLHQGIPLSLQSPLSFLSRPERWLWAIHQHRVSLSGAPNFAYELCVRRIPEQALEGLDLSSWRCALNGAEPVNADTLERFARRFAPCGFRREALLPVYGLAENSVALCIPPLGRGPLVTRIQREPFERARRAEPADLRDPAPLRFVSVGTPLPHHEVRIVDEAGQDLPDRSVGRLVFRGPSMMSGYFKQPEATAAITLPGGWLDSGDLAFRAEGEIHIAGRSKDLIIKAGRNLVPAEIEEATAGVPGIRRGCVAAFGVEQEGLGTESLVVVAETRAEDPAEQDRIVAGVVDAVAEAVGVPPDAVRLVPPGSVPKTSSGKIRRGATKELYLGGALGRAPRTSRARQLHLLSSLLWHQTRLRLERFVRLGYAAYVALVLALIGLLLWPPAVFLPGRRTSMAVARLGARLFALLAGIRVSAQGLHHLKGPGPFILACNHASYADVPVLMATLPRDFVFVAKKEVLAWPFVGRFIRKAQHPTVDRWDSRESVADAAKGPEAVRRGDCVLFFPEGTFTEAAGLRPFRLGAFKAAVETKTAVLPLALSGTRRILRDGMFRPRPGHVDLWIGAPIAPEGDDWRAAVALRDQVANAVAAHCGEIRLDLVSGAPPRP